MTDMEKRIEAAAEMMLRWLAVSKRPTQEQFRVRADALLQNIRAHLSSAPEEGGGE